MDTSAFLKSLGSQLTIEGGEVPHEHAASGKAPEDPKVTVDNFLAEQAKEDPIIISNLTPSGILVEYSPSPKRFYRVNGVEVPSVTTVLDCLEKGGLPWWGMKIGVEGVVKLFEQGLLQTFVDWKDDCKEKVSLVVDERRLETWAADTDSIIDLLKQEKLTVNHVRDQAGARGTNVHDALEQWAKSGGEFFPTPQNFPEAERGYVEGLLAWIDDLKPVPVMWETMVGMEDYPANTVVGYAGRYDLVVATEDYENIVVKTYPKKDPKKDHIPGGRLMVDLKTSKGVYPATNFRQLAAYEAASVECGYPATDGQYILRVTVDGKYEFVRSTATIDDFLRVLDVWQSNQGLK